MFYNCQFDSDIDNESNISQDNNKNKEELDKLKKELDNIKV